MAIQIALGIAIAPNGPSKQLLMDKFMEYRKEILRVTNGDSNG